MPRYYTVGEVNEMIPQLEDIFARVLQLRSQLKPIFQRLEAKKYAPSGDDFDPMVAGAPPDVVRDRVTLKALLECVMGEVAEVERLGGMIKDIETGLCDFFARAAGRDVLLCWRYGEKECAFYHELQAGFAGRRPVAELRQ